MLSIDEAIMSEMNQHEFSDYNNYHKQIAEWLEELKAIKEMDLSIPQHFTKEQSDWIKAYCIQRNKEFYNKAIDDFADKIISLCDDGEFTNRFNEFTATTTLELAEQLKAGGGNGT